MTDQVAARRLSRIKVLAERIESRRESNEFPRDTADAFELAKLVFEWLNREGIPDEAPGSTHAKLDERLDEIEGRLADLEHLFEIEGRLAELERIFGTLSDGQRDNFRTMLSRTEHNCDRISALELFTDELRREDVGVRLAKLEFRAEGRLAAKAGTVDVDEKGLDERPVEGERWRSPGGVVYWIDGGGWDDGYPNTRTRRHLLADGWTRVETSTKGNP